MWAQITCNPAPITSSPCLPRRKPFGSAPESCSTLFPRFINKEEDDDNGMHIVAMADSINVSTGDDQHQDEARPVKRRKIRLACRPCRDKKIRCDGGRPLCSACTRKKISSEECVYSDAPPDLDVQYVKTLEERIKDLERSRVVPAMENTTPGSAIVMTPSNAEHGRGYGHHDHHRLPWVEATRRQSFLGSDDSHAAAVQLVGLQSQGRCLGEGPRPDTSGTVPSSASYSHRPSRPSHRSPSLPPPLSALSSMSVSGPLPSPQARVGSGGTLRPRLSSVANQANDGDEGETDEGGDVMGAADGPSDETGRTVFLGPSSAAAFMRQVQDSSEAKGGNTHSNKLDESVTGPSTTATPASLRIAREKSKRNQEELAALMDSVILPPRRTADRYMEKYWESSHALYPVLHQSTFMRRYEAMWRHSHPSDQDPYADDTVHSVRAFQATFNILLALGCSYSVVSDATETSTSSHRSAESFFARSQALLKDVDYDHGSLQLVQALILSAQYLQSTDMVNKCWVTVGIAIRVAQGIGIHVDRRSESQAGREERRRTWWCCLLLDRVLSMTLGRPPMVTWPTTIPMPAPIDDADLLHEAGTADQPLQPRQDVVCRTAFFAHTLKLTNVMMMVLKNLYRPAEEMDLGSNGSPETISLLKVVELDTHLARWRQETPSHLTFPPSHMLASNDKTSVRQATALQTRYLHLRILLFRPMMMHLSTGTLSEAQASGRSTDFQYATLTSCVRSCISAAVDLVQICLDQMYPGSRPPWWYSIFYLYTAGTVLLSALISPGLQQLRDQQAGSSDDELEQTLLQCLSALHEYQDEYQGRAFARRCLRILQAVNTRRTLKDSDDGRALADTEGAAIGHQLLGFANGDLGNGTAMPEGGNVVTGMDITTRVAPFEQFLMGGENDLADIWWPGGGQLWSGSGLALGDQVDIGVNGYDYTQ